MGVGNAPYASFESVAIFAPMPLTLLPHVLILLFGANVGLILLACPVFHLSGGLHQYLSATSSPWHVPF